MLFVIAPVRFLDYDYDYVHEHEHEVEVRAPRKYARTGRSRLMLRQPARNQELNDGAVVAGRV